MLNGMVARLALDLAGPGVCLHDLTSLPRALEPRPHLLEYQVHGIVEAFDRAYRGDHLAIFVPAGLMRRARSRVLVEQDLPLWDLTHVLDLGGCYLLGQPMPTMLLLARAQPPSSETVLVLERLRGEPATPARPEDGLVWQSVLRHARAPGGDEWTRCAAVPRSSLAVHPWGEAARS